jgi:5-methylcytosine-specific restriction endonuclease McrA
MDASTRRQVRKRAGDRCEYCRLPQSAAPFLTFHVEHIQASQHIEDDSLSNLCLACPHCNLHKGPNLTTLESVTRELIPLFHPREQEWDEHFRFASARIEGLTPTGKATARLLKMNDDDQTEIRAALMTRGEF